jgi:hypothetical protein
MFGAERISEGDPIELGRLGHSSVENAEHERRPYLLFGEAGEVAR